MDLSIHLISSAPQREETFSSSSRNATRRLMRNAPSDLRGSVETQRPSRPAGCSRARHTARTALQHRSNRSLTGTGIEGFMQCTERLCAEWDLLPATPVPITRASARGSGRVGEPPGGTSRAVNSYDAEVAVSDESLKKESIEATRNTPTVNQAIHSVPAGARTRRVSQLHDLHRARTNLDDGPVAQSPVLNARAHTQGRGSESASRNNTSQKVYSCDADVEGGDEVRAMESIKGTRKETECAPRRDVNRDGPRERSLTRTRAPATLRDRTGLKSGRTRTEERRSRFTRPAPATHRRIMRFPR